MGKRKAREARGMESDEEGGATWEATRKQQVRLADVHNTRGSVGNAP